MLTSLNEEYRFNKNTLSKYLEITEETIDGVVTVSYTHLDVYKRQIKEIPLQGGLVVKRDPKTGLNYLSIKGNEAQGVSVIITSDKDIETLNKLADEFQKYPVSSQLSTAELYALLEISGNLKREKDGFTFLTPNGITYIPYDGDSSKAWEIDMSGSCYATARKCLAAENDCADISTWTKILKGIKIYYGDNYGTTQENNAYKVDNLGRYCMFA